MDDVWGEDRKGIGKRTEEITVETNGVRLPPSILFSPPRSYCLKPRDDLFAHKFKRNDKQII